MITPLNIITLDQGKIWRAPPGQNERPAEAPTAEAIKEDRRTWAWIWLGLPVRQRPV